MSDHKEMINILKSVNWTALLIFEIIWQNESNAIRSVYQTIPYG